jgi:hypothetical protein
MKAIRFAWLIGCVCFVGCADAGGLIVVEREDVDAGAECDAAAEPNTTDQDAEAQLACADAQEIDASMACVEKNGSCL